MSTVQCFSDFRLTVEQQHFINKHSTDSDEVLLQCQTKKCADPKIQSTSEQF